MTDDITIAHEQNGAQGRYVIRLDSGETAEMTYVVRAPDLRDFNHTFVPEVFRGTGVAGKLMTRAIEDAKAGGFKIVPTCSYVDAQFRRHPEWTDLRA